MKQDVAMLKILNPKEQAVPDYGSESAVVHSKEEVFDKNGGSWFERLLFNNRIKFLIICSLVTILLGSKLPDVRINADFYQTIPTHQAFIVNYLEHSDKLQSQANAIQIAVTADRGNIVNAHYLDVLQHISDQVYLMSGVNRPFMQSLWTPNSRWTAVTPDGLDSGPVIGDSYDGSPRQLEMIRENIQKSGLIGKLVSADFKSSMIYVPLLETDNVTGKPLGYGSLAGQFENLRKQYATQGVSLHIIGYAMVVGDMINGIDKVLVFFAVSVVIAAVFLFWYTRCIRSTMLVVIASLLAVVWQMGVLSILGFNLTPYSVLVPFLIFAIGMSHGAQKMNGVMQDIGRGTPPLVAARHTFRRLFLAGFAALICDMASFAVLMTIQIVAIRQLATIASIGVGILIITNLMLLPTILSYTGVSKGGALRSLKNAPTGDQPRLDNWLWNFLDRFTKRRFAVVAVIFMLAAGVVGWGVGRNVQVGDLNKGAPELRQDSVYNRDNAFIISHFSTGNDTFIVFNDTPSQACMNYSVVSTLDRLQWKLQQLPVVQSTNSIASFSEYTSMLLTEDAPKWFGIEPNQPMLESDAFYLPADLTDTDCSFAPLYISLYDHKAKTLTSVVDTVQKFIGDPRNQSPDFKMSLAGGNAGIDAATNIVIKQANRNMLILVYAVVTLFCFITFRSWRAVLCAVLPLTLTSILAQALMVTLGIGIKVATLPVVALGVGIGVDYALYVLSIMLKHLRQGASLSDAYHHTLLFTGRVVILTGTTLAVGVITWMFAPIKFQADMGLLLSFMFILNMLGAMILLPALAYFLLPPKLFSKPSP
jgi:predicted RND superfamily exporter protein